MRKRQLIHWLCLSGPVGLVFYALHDVIGARSYPGYDWMRQAVSDLTSLAAPSFMVARGLSSVYSLFGCLCCALICIVAQGKGNRAFRLGVYLFAAMNWVSGIGYSLFPLSESGYAGRFQDIMHLYVVTTLVVGLSIASLILIAAGCRKAPKCGPLAVFSLAALACMLAGAIGVNAAPRQFFGVAERFSVYSAVVFTAVLGVFGFHGFEPHPARARSS